MKKVFRIMGLCALVALTATSCKKDEQKLTSSLKAELTQPTNNAKTHLSGSDLLWNEGDAIKVFDDDGTAYLFTTTDNNVAEATFTGEDDIDANQSYTAFYPADGASLSGNDEVLLTLAATQTYAEGTFGNATYPMAATNTQTSFTFHSPCGLLAIPVKGTGSIGSIVLTSKTASESIAGQLRYDLSGNYLGLANGQTTVALSCGGVGLNATDSTVFYFALPAGVFANGFTAVLNDVMGAELSTLSTTNNNAIAAEMIRMMPTVTVGATGVEIVEESAQADPTDPTQCTLSGTVTYSPGLVVEEVGFYYGEAAKGMNDLPGNLTNKVTLDYVPASGTSFEYVLTGLTGGTSYQYCIYIKISGNETYGTVESFTTTEQTYDIAVSANPTAGGTVSGAGTYTQGQSHTVTATANTSYAFVNWTEGCTVVSTNASYSFTVEADRTLVANFGQIAFTENFEDGQLPAGWTAIDADGDGYNWVFITNVAGVYLRNPEPDNIGHNDSHNFLMSGSYTNVGPRRLRPDNYIVTPKVHLVNGSHFSFYACAHARSVPGDRFGVFVSDNGTSDWTKVNEWAIIVKGGGEKGVNGRDGDTRGSDYQGNWYQYEVDLSDYAGQQKYIAIRHFNSYDVYLLDVDDIKLEVVE